MTGFTLPGMIDEPGWRSGILISASPARGPEPISRRSLQILTRRDSDRPRRAAGGDESVTCSRCLEMVGGLGEREAEVGAEPAITRRGEAGGRVEAGADRRPAQGKLG